ncbi:2-amino-4-hydroxy-6-hydroxymethyldihydropteridine diphosphokinase [Epibacterium ulvae]|jgi:2-amino-4-hydroxy-6-hydroxymethyldihydropteridine diphosphokinase|uniref:2-amino-4-hydroxy-6- hydroxymethyldihydropteridine diphosphokinase n=1 Tax=Epibacterium ulvae TaxID=1156985 RepID=UPI001BFC2065|nr:2-amino-4-hydroxy-6-hydroxymethyldihydropteridine diphosphokinase [Epibacterium ulvae]MBT8153375.1 2-amino-4-hydroxy-6-hydroxymethyldihydropteridine diphosphokinase [Epibacterium ulvae]
MTKVAPKALIALGGNLPFGELAPEETLFRAIDALDRAGLKPLSTSRFFTTPCFPKGAGPDYVNAALVTETELSPQDVLAILHEVEAAFSRTRDQRWGMRTLDLDLLALDDQILPDMTVYTRWLNLPQKEQVATAPEQLILPHPRIQDRGFVLIPLCDVAPDWMHPALNLTVRQMADRLSPEEIREIVPI